MMKENKTGISSLDVFVSIVVVIQVGLQAGSGYSRIGGWSTRLRCDWRRDGHSHMDDIRP